MDFRHCALKGVDVEFCNFWFKAYRFYEKGLFFKGTCWGDQPNKYIQILSFIENEVGKIAQAEEENARQQSKHITDFRRPGL